MVLSSLRAGRAQRGEGRPRSFPAIIPREGQIRPVSNHALIRPGIYLVLSPGEDFGLTIAKLADDCVSALTNKVRVRHNSRPKIQLQTKYEASPARSGLRNLTK